jgi:hypothetical protein
MQEVVPLTEDAPVDLLQQQHRFASPLRSLARPAGQPTLGDAQISLGLLPKMRVGNSVLSVANESRPRSRPMACPDSGNGCRPHSTEKQTYQASHSPLHGNRLDLASQRSMQLDLDGTDSL